MVRTGEILLDTYSTILTCDDDDDDDELFLWYG